MGTRKNRTVTTVAAIAAARTPAAPASASASASAPGLSSAVAQLPVRFVSSPHADLAELADLAHMMPPTRSEQTAPRRPSVRQHFGELRSALAEGWEIVQPIFARPLWSVADDSTTAFNFVLRRERTTRLLTVPEGRTVQRFIRERHLAVDYRR